MQLLFEGDLNVERIVIGLELYAGHKIDPSNTLLIFDEIQEVPKALTSLKYFNENAPQYQIICAGSLLGVVLHQGTSFPVGKAANLQAKSLKAYREKYAPNVSMRTSMADYTRENGLINLPLWAMEEIQLFES